MRLDEKQKIADALNQPKTTPKVPLPTLPARGAAQAATGVGRGAGQPAAPTGSIAGPLQEKDANDRRYHPSQLMLSSDGLFAFTVRPIQRLVMRDANNQAVEFIYARP